MRFYFILLVLLFVLPTNSINASYRLPFKDNINLQFTQTWHTSGNYYNSNYQWVIGPNYAIDLTLSNGGTGDIVAPENGLVKYVEKCDISGNIVIEFNGYELQMYHLNKNSISVTSGNTVVKGQVLGQMYSGAFGDFCGSSAGTHLHMKFETKQGTNDPNRIYMSGYYFDEYDAGPSGCIMRRIENGSEKLYCLPGYGSNNTFTANEPTGSQTGGCVASGFDINCTNINASGPTILPVQGTLTINPESSINSHGGDTLIYAL